MTHDSGAAAARPLSEIVTEAREMQARHGAMTVDRTVQWLRGIFSRYVGELGTRPEAAR